MLKTTSFIVVCAACAFGLVVSILGVLERRIRRGSRAAKLGRADGQRHTADSAVGVMGVDTLQVRIGLFIVVGFVVPLAVDALWLKTLGSGVNGGLLGWPIAALVGACLVAREVRLNGSSWLLAIMAAVVYCPVMLAVLVWVGQVIPFFSFRVGEF